MVAPVLLSVNSIIILVLDISTMLYISTSPVSAVNARVLPSLLILQVPDSYSTGSLESHFIAPKLTTAVLSLLNLMQSSRSQASKVSSVASAHVLVMGLNASALEMLQQAGATRFSSADFSSFLQAVVLNAAVKNKRMSVKRGFFINREFLMSIAFVDKHTSAIMFETFLLKYFF